MNRRSYLALTSGATAGAVSLTGCLGRESIVTTIDESAIDDEIIVEETKAEDGNISNDLTSTTADGFNTELHAELGDSWFYSGERSPRKGKVTSNSTVVRKLTWQAPASGEYELRLGYKSTGGYEGVYDPCFSPSMTVLSSAHIDVLQKSKTPITGDSIDHIAHSEDGKDSAEMLLRFMISVYVNRLIRHVLGARILSTTGRLVSIVTGLPNACSEEFGGRVQAKNEFSVQFCADEGDEFTIQPSFVAGVTVDNGETIFSALGNQSEGEIDIEFDITQMTVERVGRGILSC